MVFRACESSQIFWNTERDTTIWRVKLLLRKRAVCGLLLFGRKNKSSRQPTPPRHTCCTSDSTEGPSRLAWSRCTRPRSAGGATVGTPPPRSLATPRPPRARPPASPLNGLPCPATGLLPPFFAVADGAAAHAGEKREGKAGTEGTPACRPESPRSPFPGGVQVGVLEGVCDGVTVGVGVGVQQGSTTADRRASAAMAPRAAVRSRG